MSTTILASGNNKGGCGKTSNVLAIAAGLTERGYKVLTVDMDGQQSATIALGHKGAKPTLYDVFVNETEAEACIIKTAAGDLIPASRDLDALPQVMTGTGREYTLKKALEPIRAKYDFILLDMPPATNIASVNALAAADNLLIACRPESFDLEGLGLFIENVRAVKSACNKNLKIQGIAITQYMSNLTIHKDMVKNAGRIAEHLGVNIYKPIRTCAKIKEAQALHENLYKYAPRSNAVSDYNQLIDDLLSTI